MVDGIAGDNLPAELLNAVLLALWGVLPILLLTYIRQSLAVRRLPPGISLRKSEADEMGRAIALYDGVRRRLAEIEARSRAGKNIWNLVFALQPDVDQLNGDEHEDLKAHARHLRATIIRLRDLPLKRLRIWIRALSLNYALGRALVLHFAVLAVLLSLSLLPGADSAALKLTEAKSSEAIWYPFDATYFLANGIGAGVVALFAPAFYLLRKLTLAREYAPEFGLLKELVDTPVDEISDRVAVGLAGDPPFPFGQIEADAEERCFTLLGVAQSATLDQVKAAYRTRIMQSHPDRLQGMSSAIRKFAEDETRRLNAAYQEALERLV